MAPPAIFHSPCAPHCSISSDFLSPLLRERLHPPLDIFFRGILRGRLYLYLWGATTFFFFPRSWASWKLHFRDQCSPSHTSVRFTLNLSGKGTLGGLGSVLSFCLCRQIPPPSRPFSGGCLSRNEGSRMLPFFFQVHICSPVGFSPLSVFLVGLQLFDKLHYLLYIFASGRFYRTRSFFFCIRKYQHICLQVAAEKREYPSSENSTNFFSRSSPVFFL